MRSYSNYHVQSKDKMIVDGYLIYQKQLDGFEGFNVLIDGVSDKVIIRQHSNPLNEEKEDRQLECWKYTNVKRGSTVKLVDYNEDWLVVTDVDLNGLTKLSKILKCNNTLKFYKNQTLYSLPCIFTDISIDMQEGKFINLPIGHYLVYIPSGTITKADMNLRFLLNDSAYKIEGISNAVNGLIKIELVDDEIIPDDNRALGIANYYSNQPTEIPNPNPIIVTLTPSNNTLMLGRTLELIAHCYNNGVEDLTKYYLFTVTNVDGTSNEYVTTDERDNFCIITAKNNSEYAGKRINVHVNLLGEPSVYYDREIKLTALI